jgi:hypothetical protein
LGDLSKVFVEVLFFGDFGVVGSLEENQLGFQVGLMLVVDNGSEMRLIGLSIMRLYVCTYINVTVCLSKPSLYLFNPALFLAVFSCRF